MLDQQAQLGAWISNLHIVYQPDSAYSIEFSFLHDLQIQYYLYARK